MGSEPAQFEYSPSNTFSDHIATVQLSPFGEDQWHRIVTYSPIYLHWTDVIMNNNHGNILPSVYRKPSLSSSSRTKLNIKTVDINNLRLEDDLLLSELYDIRRQSSSILTQVLPDQKSDMDTVVPETSSTIIPQRKLSVVNSRKSSPMPTPIDDYKKSAGYYRVKSDVKENKDNNDDRTSVIEFPKHFRSTTDTFLDNSNTSVKVSPRRIPKHSTIEDYPVQHQDSKFDSSSYMNSFGRIKTIGNTRLYSKPNPISVDSVSVQLRQSAITRESVLDRSSPLSMMSSKRHTESRRTFQSTTTDLHSAKVRRPQQALKTTTTTPQMDRIETSTERSQTSFIKRHTKHMLKKNDVQKHKQKVKLKTILVEPWSKPVWSNGSVEEWIPNSLEMMEKLGGQSTAFEKNLKFTYNNHLKHLRNIPVK
ncbi:unnamed protein product [Didymodactylos carnosus]|uniref:Uncharacterized protein n=1 Tax=Didymodactylos carnosus TaxID=1234261 RepID=A0A813YS84_9BILA|nr:unnamed protein product [Didymodactylos carnosus]CAF0888411.1 unnamed protein product [Didymodactylos carnosus]CAF3515948.1 unnamed protein product [Didymodactylos carnosus]CAF3673191.1 unnamed protein product [Didymodactylos carnosus]